MSELKTTPLFDNHTKLNAKMVDFASYNMPILYTNIKDEHLNVRRHVGLFDVSHMGEILIEGEDAQNYVSYLFTNDIVSANNNKVIYGFMCYPDGGIVDDLLVYKYSETKFLLVVNASNIDQDFNHMMQYKDNFNVTITNLSNVYSEVAIQGPKAQAVLQKLTDFNLDDITFFTFNDGITIDGKACIVSRTGYTGEDGFEVYCANDDIADIWNKLLEIGQEEQIQPIGLGARDTLRFEAALPLYGNEIGKDITPVEANFKFFVKFNHDFIGKEVLEKQVQDGIEKKVIALKILDKGIVRQGYQVFNLEGETIGHITTGYLLPEYEHCLALALINSDYAAMDTPVKVEMRNKRLNAVVVSKKFMDKKYKK